MSTKIDFSEIRLRNLVGFWQTRADFWEVIHDMPKMTLNVFPMFFPWKYFLCGRIPSFLENGYQNVKVL